MAQVRKLISDGDAIFTYWLWLYYPAKESPLSSLWLQGFVQPNNTVHRAVTQDYFVSLRGLLLNAFFLLTQARLAARTAHNKPSRDTAESRLILFESYY